MSNFSKKKKISLNLFLIFFLLLILIKDLDFFKKSYTIFLKDINSRQQEAYDFCSYTGLGYVFYIKKKFNLNKTPLIKNTFKTPNENWIFNDFKNEIDENKIILLNYINQSQIDLSQYIILDNYENRCFLLKKND